MFGKKENEVKPAARIVSNSSNVTYMAEDCEVKGEFIANGNARIDGKLEGTIRVAGALVVGQTAKLTANIEAQNVSIAGEVRGNLKVSEMLELSTTARLYGDINTKELKIEQGARFVGKSTYEEQEIAPVSNLYSASFQNDTEDSED